METRNTEEIVLQNKKNGMAVLIGSIVLYIAAIALTILGGVLLDDGKGGGTALQINILDPDVLREAQAHPQDYRHLLVRITGYNAYFVSIGRELQDEIIARESHMGY